MFWQVKLGGEWGWPSEERERLESNESFCIGICVIYWTTIFVTKPYKGYEVFVIETHSDT
jgi:hypothetical protein